MHLAPTLTASISSRKEAPPGSVVRPKTASRGGRSSASAPATQFGDQPGESLGWAGHSYESTHQSPQVRLPAVVLGKRPTGGIHVVAGVPIEHERGSAHGISVDEICETSGPSEPGRTAGKDGERTEAGVVSSGAQHFEHCPDETVDLPGILEPAPVSSLEHRLTQRSGEGELDVRGDAVTGPGPGRAQ